MKLLFIGYSNLLKKRIFPILDRINSIDSVEIAKFDSQSWDDEYKCISKPLKLYDDYESALNTSNADFVYISTTNNSHYKLAKMALNAGMHTIIDKPATIELSETEELLNIATEKNLLLTESTVYTYHPQIKLIKSIFEKENSKPKLITVLFSFPPFPADNFRYKKELGGGALLDTGPYAVSVGRCFFDSLPISCNYLVNNSLDDDLEISYSLLMKYSDGRSLIGNFGFNTEYINHINILGENLFIDVDRVFTIPEDLQNKISVRSKNKSFEVFSTEANTFEFYLKAVFLIFELGDYTELYSDMLNDAIARNLIKKNRLCQ